MQIDNVSMQLRVCALSTCAMSIQRWMMRARRCGRICRCRSIVLTTHAVTALNWVMVARMVGAQCLPSFLSRWDQTEPKQWWGTIFLNNSCESKDTSLRCKDEQAWTNKLTKATAYFYDYDLIKKNYYFCLIDILLCWLFLTALSQFFKNIMHA